MAETKPQPNSDAPFGTEPRRAAWPLVTLILIFVLWCGVLVWLAVQYPAR